MNDMNEAVNDSSLRLYADDTTQYMADKNATVLQFSLNQDMERLSSWLDHNYLQANGDKTQAMVVGKNTHHYDLKFNGASIDIKEHLKILGVHLDNKLSFQEHINEMLKKVFAKIAALRRLKRLVPSSTLLVLYRNFVLLHFEYCNSLLIGIGKTLNKKLEDANHYGLRTIMNLGRSINYESTLKTADMNTLEHRRIEQSLIIFYKCYKENGPSYLADLFEPRITPYNLRNTGLNVTQNSYNSKFRHNSYSFVISRIWNKLPPSVKIAPNLSSFRRKLKTFIFTGCQCKSYLLSFDTSAYT